MHKLYGPSHCYCMGLYPISSMPSFILFLSFLFFFSNYLQNGKSFEKQDSKVITFKSPIDPINYRVITVAPPRDGTLLVKCQESCFLTFWKTFSIVAFVVWFVLFWKFDDNVQWIRAFSVGFNHLINVIHSKNCK